MSVEKKEAKVKTVIFDRNICLFTIYEEEKYFRYLHVGKIAVGEYNIVYLWKNIRNSHLIAIKIPKNFPCKEEDLKKECNIGAKVYGELKFYLIRIFTEEGSNLGIVMPYLGKRSLRKYFKQILPKKDDDEKHRIWLDAFKKAGKAVLDLHKSGIVHLDIHLHNFVVKKTRNMLKIRLTDFEFSKEMAELTEDEKKVYLKYDVACFLERFFKIAVDYKISIPESIKKLLKTEEEILSGDVINNFLTEFDNVWEKIQNFFNFNLLRQIGNLLPEDFSLELFLADLNKLDSKEVKREEKTSKKLKFAALGFFRDVAPNLEKKEEKQPETKLVVSSVQLVNNP